MRNLFGEIQEKLAEIEKSGKLIPLRIEPPTAAGTKDLGELPPELKNAYTLIEVFLAEIGKEKAKPKKSSNPVLLTELELKRKIAADVFQLRFRQKYGVDEAISLYSDWHAYKVPIPSLE